MSIRDFNRRDTIACTVLYKNSKGSVLKINSITENPYVILHDVFLNTDSTILVSIAYISQDRGYVKVRPDSLLDYSVA